MRARKRMRADERVALRAEPFAWRAQVCGRALMPTRKSASASAPASESVLVAVDTGGTFTDVVCLHDGELHTLKVPSTPANPAAAVLSGVQQILAQIGIEDTPYALVHGSTVATNALLERKGARVALITNRGFEDVLEIGRQTRPQLYGLSGYRKPPLVPAERRLGITGRTGPQGEELEAIDPAELAQLSARLSAVDAQSIAVCLLHSYAHPAAELAVAEALKNSTLPITLSHQILAEYREYERTATSVVNAFVAPLMGQYLAHLEEELGATTVRIMGSSGGAIALGAARRQPVHTVLSGPGGRRRGRTRGRTAGRARAHRELRHGRHIDRRVDLPGPGAAHARVHDRLGAGGDSGARHPHGGAGGGSIAWIDAGGALRVGPQSSGALPGPICYGRGGKEVTVTDAQVWLNRLPADAFLGGQATLDRASIEGPLNELAAKLGSSPERAAEGVIEVVNTAMEGALRVITVERGYDPVDFTLVAFGGAAGLHATELAVRLGIPRILLPRDPGLLSAFGMLVSPVRKDAARTVLLGTDSAATERMEAVFGELEQVVLQQMSEENVSTADVQLSRTVDARYRGQSFELRVPAEGWVEGLHRAHEVRYGYAQPAAAVEAVTLRVMAVVPAPAVPSRPLDTLKKKPAPEGTVDVVWQNTVLAANRYQRAQLLAGQSVEGPAVLVEYSSTGWVPPGWSARVDATGQIVLEKAVS